MKSAQFILLAVGVIIVVFVLSYGVITGKAF